MKMKVNIWKHILIRRLGYMKYKTHFNYSLIPSFIIIIIFLMPKCARLFLGDQRFRDDLTKDPQVTPP